MKNMFYFFVLSSLFFLSAAQPPSEDSCINRMRGWKDLNLSKEQKEKLIELHKEISKIRKSHIDSVIAIRGKIKEELLKDKPSLSILEKYTESLGELHKDITQKRIEHLLKVKNILTKEQLEAIVSFEEKEIDFMGRHFLRRNPPSRCCPYRKEGRGREKEKCPFNE